MDKSDRTRTYCSTECHNKAQTIKNVGNCKRCGNEFFWFGNRKKPRKFCSVSCTNNWILTNLKKGTGPEKLVAEILQKHNIRYESQFLIEDKSYDFHIVDTNILIEVDGTYWHGKNKADEELNTVQQINRHNDAIKNELAKRLNYKLIRVWEDEIVEENLLQILRIKL
jgi:very-short-patch-repair endonuclease